MTFRIEALTPETFRPLFDLDDAALAARGAKRVVADAKPGFPCRVSLEDAEPGEELLLVRHEHHATDSPYRGEGPIYVRRNAGRSWTGVPGEVPEMLRRRLLAVRAYDANGMLVDAEVCHGTALEETFAAFFADPAAAYLNVHIAKPGCFACRVDRA